MTDKTKATKTGKQLEQRVAQAYRDMGAWKVEHDVEMAGNQIDVYVEMEAARGLLHRIAVEAKDWSSTVGIDVVNGFAAIVSLLRQANLIDAGVIVSATGFSRPARNAVDQYGVVLLEPADLDAMVEEAKRAGRSRPSTPPVPQMPAPYIAHPYPAQEHFTGRHAQRETLTAWLGDDADPLLAVIAMGGMGKSALAWHWFKHDLEPAGLERWDLDGVVWWSFYDTESGFERFLGRAVAYASSGELDPTGWSVRDRMETLRTLLQEKRLLLVLDGFERLLRAYARMDAAYVGDDAEDGAVPPAPQRACADPNVATFVTWLAGLEQTKTLMTSRLMPRELEGLAGVRRLDLTQMDPEEAVRFFHAMKIEGTRAEIQAACKPYGYLPLALRLLAGMVSDDPDRPGDIAVAIDYEITEDLRGKERHHILERAYGALGEMERGLLSRIAAFRSPVGYATLAALFGPGEEGFRFASEGALKAALRTLVRRGLLLRQGEAGRYDLHPIVRRYTYDRLSDADREDAHGQLRDYFADVPVPERPEALDDLVPVIELYHHTVRAGQLDEAVRLFGDRINIATYYQLGAYQLRIELLRGLFPDGEDRPPRLADEGAQSWTLNALANSYSLSGQPRRAMPLLKQGNAIDEKQGDKGNLVIGLANLANRHAELGELRAAEANLRRQIDLCREIEDEEHEGTAHYELGRVLAYTGRWDDAVAHLNTGEEIKKRTGHVQAQGIIWAYRALRALLLARASAVGATHSRERNASGPEVANGKGVPSRKHSPGNASPLRNAPSPREDFVEEALAAARLALELAEETARTQYPHPRDFVRAQWLLGAAHRASGDTLAAEQHLGEAITRCRRINLVEMEADILLDLARLRAAQGQREEALRLAREALVITERSEYVLQGADVHLFLAQIEIKRGDREAALAHAALARELATCDGPPDYTYKVAYDEAGALLAALAEGS